MNSLSCSRNYYEFNIFFSNLLLFANWRWIFLLFRNFTLNSLPVSLDLIFKIKNVNSHFFTCNNAILLYTYFANLQWMHFLLRDSTMNPLFICKFAKNRLSSSWNYYEFTIYLRKWIEIDCLIFRLAPVDSFDTRISASRK